MPVKFKRKVFESGNSLRINIPMPIANTLGIKNKDTLVIYMDNHRIIIEKEEQ